MFRKIKKKKGQDSEDDFMDMLDDEDGDLFDSSDDDGSADGKSRGRGRPRKSGGGKKRGLDFDDEGKVSDQ